MHEKKKIPMVNQKVRMKTLVDRRMVPLVGRVLGYDGDEVVVQVPGNGNRQGTYKVGDLSWAEPTDVHPVTIVRVNELRWVALREDLINIPTHLPEGLVTGSKVGGRPVGVGTSPDIAFEGLVEVTGAVL